MYGATGVLRYVRLNINGECTLIGTDPIKKHLNSSGALPDVVMTDMINTALILMA